MGLPKHFEDGSNLYSLFAPTSCPVRLFDLLLANTSSSLPLSFLGRPLIKVKSRVSMLFSCFRNTRIDSRLLAELSVVSGDDVWW